MATQSPLIARVCHAALQTPDPEASLRHATEILGLRESERLGDTVYLSCGSRHHDLQLIAGERVGLHHIGLEATGHEALAEVERRARARGAEVVSSGPSDEPGIEQGIRLLAPGDHVIEVHGGMLAEAPPPDGGAAVAPLKLGHVTVTTPDRAELEDFLEAVLGFIPSDRVGTEAVWMRCNNDHHGIAILDGAEAGLRHFAWELPAAADLFTVADAVIAHGLVLSWGPGRHGPGNNLACYHVDPVGATHEHLNDLEQIDDPSWRGRDWEDVPRWRNLWGPQNDPVTLAGEYPRVLGPAAVG